MKELIILGILLVSSILISSCYSEEQPPLIMSNNHPSISVFETSMGEISMIDIKDELKNLAEYNRAEMSVKVYNGIYDLIEKINYENNYFNTIILNITNSTNMTLFVSSMGLVAGGASHFYNLLFQVNNSEFGKNGVLFGCDVNSGIYSDTYNVRFGEMNPTTNKSLQKKFNLTYLFYPNKLNKRIGFAIFQLNAGHSGKPINCYIFDNQNTMGYVKIIFEE